MVHAVYKSGINEIKTLTAKGLGLGFGVQGDDNLQPTLCIGLEKIEHYVSMIRNLNKSSIYSTIKYQKLGHHKNENFKYNLFDDPKTTNNTSWWAIYTETANTSENRGGQQREKPTTLIPIVGDGHFLKTTRDEQSEKEWRKINN